MLRTKSKALVIAITTALVTTSLMGCGSTKPTTSEVTPTVTQKKDFSGVHLKVSAYRNLKTDGNNSEYGRGADEFMKQYPGSSVEFLVQGTQGNDQSIVAAVASGQPQDLHLVIGPAIPRAYQQDLYEPIDKLVNVNDSTFSKITTDATLWKGQHYGVSSVWMTDIESVLYNENWYKELGVKPPYDYYKEGKWNYSSWFQMLEDLKAKGVDSKTGVIDYEKPRLFQQYSQKWNKDGTAVDTFTSKQELDALNFWKKNFVDYNVPMASKGDIYNRVNPFILSIIPNIMNNQIGNKKESKDTIRYIPAPTQDGRTSACLVDYHFSVLKGSKNAEAAMELAKYMIKQRNKEIQDKFKANMTAEDFEIMKKSVDNGVIIHGVPGQPYIAWKTVTPDLLAGKPVSTLISENADKYKTAVDAWNKEVKQ